MKLSNSIFLMLGCACVCADASLAEATSSSVESSSSLEVGAFVVDAGCLSKATSSPRKIKAHSDEMQLITAELIKADEIQEKKKMLKKNYSNNMLNYMGLLLKKRRLYARAIIKLAPCQGASTIKQYLERELTEQVNQEAKKLAAEFDSPVSEFGFNELVRPIKSILDKDYQIYNVSNELSYLPLTEYLDSDACKVQ